MNSNTVISSDGDTISRIAYRHYGSSRGHVEKIMAANPKLCRYPAILPAGIAIRLPAEQQQATILPTVNLWD